MFELMNFINFNVIFTLPTTNYSDTTSSFGQPTIHTLLVIQTKQVVNLGQPLVGDHVLPIVPVDQTL